MIFCCYRGGCYRRSFFRSSVAGTSHITKYPTHERFKLQPCSCVCPCVSLCVLVCPCVSPPFLLPLVPCICAVTWGARATGPMHTKRVDFGSLPKSKSAPDAGSMSPPPAGYEHLPSPHPHHQHHIFPVPPSPYPPSQHQQQQQQYGSAPQQYPTLVPYGDASKPMPLSVQRPSPYHAYAPAYDSRGSFHAPGMPSYLDQQIGRAHV